MPNTPLLLGEGASALAKAEPTTDEEFEFVKNIFASSGAAEVVPINKMKEIIAINGSSVPAFIYLCERLYGICEVGRNRWWRSNEPFCTVAYRLGEDAHRFGLYC